MRLNNLKSFTKTALITQSGNAVIAFYYPTKDEPSLIFRTFLLYGEELSNAGLSDGLIQAAILLQFGLAKGSKLD